MTTPKTIKTTLLGAAGALILTTMMASFQPADAGPVVRNRVKGALAGAAVGAIVGDPAKGAQIGAAVGTVLWASLYGIASLAVSQKLPEAETPEDMAASLATNYIVGLRIQCAA